MAGRDGMSTTRLHVAAIKIQTFARIVILEDEKARRDSDFMFCNAVAQLAEQHGLKLAAQSARSRQPKRRPSGRSGRQRRTSKTPGADGQGGEVPANGRLRTAAGEHMVV